MLLKLGFRHAEEEPWILRRDAFQLDLHQHPLGRHHHAFGWDLRRATQSSLPLTQRRGLYRFTFRRRNHHCSFACRKARLFTLELAGSSAPYADSMPGRLAAILNEAGGQRYLLYTRWLLARLANQPPPPDQSAGATPAGNLSAAPRLRKPGNAVAAAVHSLTGASQTLSVAQPEAPGPGQLAGPRPATLATGQDFQALSQSMSQSAVRSASSRTPRSAGTPTRALERL